ncbi:MAG TPA: CRTAC1 family protein [Acidobacteriota bacterium]|jgi:hypothetical protein|nr:CRTAC1 family protein [Acidobacteriota bacterium]
MRKKGKPLIFSGVLAPVILFFGAFYTVDHASSRAERFFNTGKTVVEALQQLARAVQSRDVSAIERFYAPNFRGNRLGFGNLQAVREKDHVRELRFVSETSAIDLNAALGEWREYLSGFESVDEVGIYVHRLEKWDSADEWIAVVRFELIGTPKGARHAGIDRAFFRIKFDPRSGVPTIRETALLEGNRVLCDVPHFENVAPAARIDFMNRYYPPFLTEPLKFGMIRYGPGGISAVDYDNDGFYDLFIPDGVESKLFRNRGDGTFEDVTANAGLSGLDGVSVGVFADYDNDGFKDLFVSRTFRHNQLFHNNGDGTFTDVTGKSGIGEDSCATVASWGDYDNDGYLDLYVGRYLDPRKEIPTTFYARNGLPNQLYHNNGDGTFTNVTAKAGVGDTGLCLGSVWGDYDNDGYPDLYVVNDFGRNTLYHNNGNGTFTDVSVKSNTLDYGAGMSASFADYDNDGKLDIYVANIRSEHAWFAEEPTVAGYMINCFRQGVWKTDMPLYWEIFRQSGLEFVGVFQQMASGNTLLRNKGDGTFEDVTWKANANPPGWFWGASFADFDNDGWQDIYVADGWAYNDKGTEIELDFLHNVVSRQKEYKTGIFFDPKYFGRKSWHGWERNRMLRNNGDGTFQEIGRAADTDLLINSRGVAVADFWNRGVLDIAVSASTDRHALLKNLVGVDRNWLGVELMGTKSNRDAVGARVTIRIGGKQQMREVVLGDGYGSQNSLRQYFGLDRATSVDEMTVRWPRSGIVQTFRSVGANRIVQVTEGRQELVERHYPIQ